MCHGVIQAVACMALELLLSSKPLSQSRAKIKPQFHAREHVRETGQPATFQEAQQAHSSTSSASFFKIK